MKRNADTIPTPLFQAFDTASDNSLFIYYCICVHFVCLSSHLYRSILLLLVVVVACASGPRGVFVRVPHPCSRFRPGHACYHVSQVDFEKNPAGCPTF